MTAVRRISVFGLASLLAATPAAADTIITADEVISCSVVSVDTNFVRVKLPQGGIRVFVTRDVYEVRVADSSRVESLAVRFPAKVRLDSGQVIPPPATRARELGQDASAEPPLDAAELARWKQTGFTDGVGRTQLQVLLATGGSCALGIAGGVLFPGAPIQPAAVGTSVGCLGGCAVASPKPVPPSSGSAAREAYSRGFQRGACLSGGAAMLGGALTGALVVYLIAFSAIERGTN